MVRRGRLSFLLAFFFCLLTCAYFPTQAATRASLPAPDAALKSLPNAPGVSASIAPGPLHRPALQYRPPHVTIPHLDAAPKLDEFLAGPLRSKTARQMLRVSNFIQRYPEDGKPATEPTVAYLGYTHEFLYVVFVCTDHHPNLIRAHMLQRDLLSDDDFVEVLLDTFHDERRGFLFKTNALGIEADALYTEQQGSDYSFDTVWDTWGQKLPNGY